MATKKTEKGNFGLRYDRMARTNSEIALSIGATRSMQ